MTIFRTIRNTYVRATDYIGKMNARQDLLRLSDRQLQDAGISRELLLAGISAWPWRLDNDGHSVVTAYALGNAVAPAGHEHGVENVIKELSTYTDRQLTDMGFTRGMIKEALLNGRPAADGQIEPLKHAA